MKFGNYGDVSVLASVRYSLDKEPDWWWEIKPVTSGMELDMSKFLSYQRWIDTPEGRKVTPPTSFEIAFREIAMTFNGTNIPKGEASVEDGGEPILKVSANIKEIEDVLATFPRSLIEELWIAVGKAYPLWGPVVHTEDAPNE